MGAQIVSRLQAVAGLAFMLVCLAIVGISDKQRMDDQTREYCNMVRDGLWPDYKKTFKAECGGKNPPQFNEDLTK